MGRGIFVTGTDTGAGKTFVCRGIARALRGRGWDVGVMKPVESGCRRVDGRLVPEDAAFLHEAAGSSDRLEEVNPYSLEHPLAPALAAELEGVDIRVEVIQEAYRRLAERHDLVLVEGAGGLLVPITGNYFMADLARDLGLPLLVVSRAQLGTINHTLLTLSHASRMGIPVLGVVMNNVTAQTGLAESCNAGALQRWIGVPFLGAMPFVAGAGSDEAGQAVVRHLDLGRVEAWLKAPLEKDEDR